jgi:hypothetical protein
VHWTTKHQETERSSGQNGLNLSVNKSRTHSLDTRGNKERTPQEICRRSPEADLLQVPGFQPARSLLSGEVDVIIPLSQRASAWSADFFRATRRLFVAGAPVWWLFDGRWCICRESRGRLHGGQRNVSGRVLTVGASDEKLPQEGLTPTHSDGGFSCCCPQDLRVCCDVQLSSSLQWNVRNPIQHRTSRLGSVAC